MMINKYKRAQNKSDDRRLNGEVVVRRRNKKALEESEDERLISKCGEL